MLGQYSSTSNGGGSPVATLIYLVIAVVDIVAMWRLFTKAGQPGWAAIIPIYNLYVLVKIAGREGWWVILYFIPFVNIVVWFIVAIDVAKNFGKSTGFGIGIALLSFIFIPILAFGDAQYIGARPGVGASGATPPPPPPPPLSSYSS
ncbi:MAG: DUF5684 domain-containing protein [Actinomycetota bacterium]